MALLIVRGEITSALPGGVSGFVVLTAASCIVDFGAAWLVVRDRARGPMLGYLAARTVLAASGVVFLALPSYAVGAATLFASPRPAAGPARRHAFEPPDPTASVKGSISRIRGLAAPVACGLLQAKELPCCSRSGTSWSAVSSEPEVVEQRRGTSSSWCSATR